LNVALKLEKGDALSSLLFNFALEYAIRKHWNWMENQLLVYAGDVNTLGEKHKYHK